PGAAPRALTDHQPSSNPDSKPWHCVRLALCVPRNGVQAWRRYRPPGDRNPTPLQGRTMIYRAHGLVVPAALLAGIVLLACGKKDDAQVDAVAASASAPAASATDAADAAAATTAPSAPHPTAAKGDNIDAC